MFDMRNMLLKLDRSRCASCFKRSDGATTASCAVLVSRSPILPGHTRSGEALQAPNIARGLSLGHRLLSTDRATRGAPRHPGGSTKGSS
jgi:hypothetical protein